HAAKRSCSAQPRLTRRLVRSRGVGGSSEDTRSTHSRAWILINRETAQMRFILSNSDIARQMEFSGVSSTREVETTTDVLKGGAVWRSYDARRCGPGFTGPAPAP